MNYHVAVQLKSAFFLFTCENCGRESGVGLFPVQFLWTVGTEIAVPGIRFVCAPKRAGLLVLPAPECLLSLFFMTPPFLHWRCVLLPSV